MKRKKEPRAPSVPLLFVCVPSVQAEETASVLQAKGLVVTRADNVCFAEIYADAERFEAALYDHSVSQEEQASLARVMRIRWPWMRLLRWVADDAPLLEDELYDWSVRTRPELVACVELRLLR